MIAKSIYQFNGNNDTGISEIPLQSLIEIRDISGFNRTDYYTLLSKVGINPATTIGEALAIDGLLLKISINVEFDYDEPLNEMNIIIKEVL